MGNKTFYEQIQQFNEMYKLPNNDKPTILNADRIDNFMNILEEEVREGDIILNKLDDIELRSDSHNDDIEKQKIEILTDLADWLGDIVVYCTSEARRWGIPMEKVLRVIMESNFSKLGADGKPIYDERGKVMKGPNYWKPEPKIKEVIENEMQ